MSKMEMSSVVAPKTRSRVITGWRQVAPAPRAPKWKKPVAPDPRVKPA